MCATIRIVFMGTASFAVPALDRLLRGGYDIPAVVTAPDKPAGRGKNIRFSPVKDYALENNLMLLQPDRLKDPAFISQLLDLKPDIQVVVAFRMLPAEVWKIPPMGTINLHASLLPQFRGAAPINHAIMQGMERTGVTTFLIDEAIDTGRVLKRAETPIGADETAGELHDRLMEIGADLTLETVQEIVSGTIAPVSQDALEQGSILHTAPKIFKEDCRIDWNREPAQVNNFIRGLSPVPGAYTTILFKDGSIKILKVFRACINEGDTALAPGSVKAEKDSISVACKKGSLELKEVQLEGKKKMQVSEFLRGFNPENLVRMT